MDIARWSRPSSLGSRNSSNIHPGCCQHLASEGRGAREFGNDAKGTTVKSVDAFTSANGTRRGAHRGARPPWQGDAIRGPRDRDRSPPVRRPSRCRRPRETRVHLILDQVHPLRVGLLQQPHDVRLVSRFQLVVRDEGGEHQQAADQYQRNYDSSTHSRPLGWRKGFLSCEAGSASGIGPERGLLRTSRTCGVAWTGLMSREFAQGLSCGASR